MSIGELDEGFAGGSLRLSNPDDGENVSER